LPAPQTKIVLGKHSFLGPIDPQFILNMPLGPRMVLAQAILDQFERAKKECEDPAKLGAWIPMLSQYGPDLLVKCENASDMSHKLVQGWLEANMFKADRDRRQRRKQLGVGFLITDISRATDVTSQDQIWRRKA
jgi:hypothetical protein